MTARELNQKLADGGAKFFGETVIVAREKTVSETKSGLFIPEIAQQKQQYAAVVSFGDMSKFGPHGNTAGWVNIGDSIYLPAYGGVLVKQKVGDEVYVLEVLNDKDVLLTYRGSGDVELEAGGSQTSA